MAAINIGFIIVTQRYFGRGSEGKSLKRGEGGQDGDKGKVSEQVAGGKC